MRSNRRPNDEEDSSDDKSKITDVGFEDLLNEIAPVKAPQPKKDKSRPRAKFEAHDQRFKEQMNRLRKQKIAPTSDLDLPFAII